ncbi:MAG TPA: prolipoprotein diacylglyceryl transferase [Ohtaekwangia sp.]|uniref:prolipoprotein diacylglyceryl transferase n=1 Tax=Ohtaekwangia sp. TaxID=2066019 RepID=UPI002F925A2E
MHPVLFKLGGLTVYSYGFMIALGTVAGVAYMVIRGKKEVGLTFDQANSLFLFIFIAAFAGGKALLFFEDARLYVQHPARLLTGRGFVFYGSFLFAIPTMFWFFKRNKLPTYAMLDIMAVTTCLVHMFGRIGCFLAGCCYGLPTDSIFGVIFTDPACHANPKGVPLHPTQLYESGYIFMVMLVLLYLREKRTFYGQLFLTYLMLYAIGRYALEFFRGDTERGFIIKDYLSHSQFIALAIFVVVVYVYNRWSKRNLVSLYKKPI